MIGNKSFIIHQGKPFGMNGGINQEGKPPRLLDRVRFAMRARHYSHRTEEAYIPWIKRFIIFHGKRHPEELGELEINTFLTNLAVKERVSASTQNQALSALLFLYRYVLDREIGDFGEVIRARKAKRLPVVLTPEEVKAIFKQLNGDKWLMASLMYGTDGMYGIAGTGY